MSISLAVGEQRGNWIYEFCQCGSASVVCACENKGTGTGLPLVTREDAL
jgi:hypothetical protein